MDKYFYTILNIITFGPLIVYLFMYHKETLKRGKKFIFISGFLGVLYFFTVDVIATSLKAWEYNYSTTLGIRFGYAVIEELIWMILVFMLTATAIEVYLHKKKLPL